MSKFILSFLSIVSILSLSVLLPNASFAASPFLVKHSSVTQAEQSGQGRATFLNQQANQQTRKTVTLAESLVHFRQCYKNDQLGENTQSKNFHSQFHALNQGANSDAGVNSSSKPVEDSAEDSQGVSQSTKVFLARP